MGSLCLSDHSHGSRDIERAVWECWVASHLPACPGERARPATVLCALQILESEAVLEAQTLTLALH